MPCLLGKIDVSTRLLYFGACCPQEQLLTGICCHDISVVQDIHLEVARISYEHFEAAWMS